MNKEVKLVGIVIAIVVVIVGIGIFLMSKSPQPTNPSTASSEDKAAAVARSTPRVRGKLDSNITVIEFGDMQCPACASANPAVDQLFKDYGDKVKFEFRHYPLPQHPNAFAGADAAEAAGDQNKFWEMVDAIYTNQKQWETATDPKPVFRQLAANIGLDAEKFDKSISAQANRSRINQDKNDGDTLGNPGTPTFYVNGEQIFQGGVADVKKKIDTLLTQNK